MTQSTHHTFPIIPSPTYLAFLSGKLSVCILVSNVEWGFSDEWPVCRDYERTRQSFILSSLFDVAGVAAHEMFDPGEKKERQLRPLCRHVCWQAQRLAAIAGKPQLIRRK